jgi:hypothetical protein
MNAYMQALGLKDYAKCFSLWDDLTYYYKLTSLSFQEPWERKLFFIKRPFLFHVAKKIKRFIPKWK